MKTNYRLKDGDRVMLLEPIKVDSYWYDEGTNTSSYHGYDMLAGCVGTVIRAYTPCVTRSPGEPEYFANVDIEHNGQVSRVRPFHNQIRLATGSSTSCMREVQP